MKFKIRSAKYGFSESEKIKYESLGFKFKPIEPEYNIYKDDYVLDKSQEYFINIDSINDLINLIQNFGSVIVDLNEITIYDDYIE